MIRGTDDVWDLTEGLLLQVFRRLVFTFHKVNLVEFEGNLLFVEHDGDTAGAGGPGITKKLENHGANSNRKFGVVEDK